MAASLADGIVLERAGVPAVSICTDAVVIPARAMADAYGTPDFEFVTIPHPIASLSPGQIEANVKAAVADVVRLLKGDLMERATELPVIDIDEVRRVIAEYAERGWTDGLPVMPVTESYLEEFPAVTTPGDPPDRDQRAASTIPAATVSLLASSMRMKLPVVRLRA